MRRQMKTVLLPSAPASTRFPAASVNSTLNRISFHGTGLLFVIVPMTPTVLPLLSSPNANWLFRDHDLVLVFLIVFALVKEPCHDDQGKPSQVVSPGLPQRLVINKQR